MSEFKLAERHGQSGFLFESPHLDMEIYRLITLVAGSKVLAEKSNDEQEGAKWEWYKRAEIPELSRLLVSIAAICRSNIDSFYGGSESGDPEIDKPVGILYPDLSAPHEKEALGFRSACNKILHTVRFNPDVENPSEGRKSALRPLVHLYGQYHGDEWKASLHVYEFAMCAGSFM